MSAREGGVVDAYRAETPGAPRARMMLQRARWASTAFAEYRPDQIRNIVNAVAEVGFQNAERFAREAVEETGMGVVEHKRRKNEASSRGLVERYAARDYASVRIDPERRIVQVPKPAGVILALTPSTNPISTVYFKVLLALMTRNAIVVSPHPMARKTSVDAVRVMAQAAVATGAPDGCIQVVEEPTIPLIEALMADPGTDVIVATGGTAVVRAAYQSGNPALGVGPGNVPAFVDASADIGRAARCLVESKAFDNSILCTNESTLIAEERIADRLCAELRSAGAAILDEEQTSRIRAACYPEGRINVALAGKHAIALAQAADINVPADTHVLVAPFEMIAPEEPLAHEKLFPLLGMVRVPHAQRGIDAALALLRIGGAGHSAVIHSHTPATILAYGAALKVLRVAVNAPGSTGSAGLDTHLPITMTVGTGFFGRSSLTESLQPDHLVQWTQVAYASDPSERFDDFTGLQPWSALPATAPVTAPVVAPDTGDWIASTGSDGGGGLSREELRRLIIAELREVVRG
jgi:acyl-CoA reductase-like NAD-dependent aldehyde dehydrogenase